MKISELTTELLSDRLQSDGVVVAIGPFLARLRTAMPELIEAIHLLYAHFDLINENSDPHQLQDLIDFDIRLDPPSGYANWRKRQAAFFVDGKRTFQPFERAIALPMLEWVINWCVFTIPNQYLILHSAVVERAGRAAILPGEPGAGKSTLCAALAHRGWRLFSDEVAVMKPRRATATATAKESDDHPHITELLPVPRPIGLKEQSIEIIRHFAPEAVIGPAIPGTRKGTVAHIQPPLQSVERAAQGAPPAWIIFPQYEPNAAASLNPITKGFTLLRIAHDAFNFSTLGASSFETAADIIEQVDCHELTYSNLDDAISIFDELAEGDGVGQ